MDCRPPEPSDARTSAGPVVRARGLHRIRTNRFREAELNTRAPHARLSLEITAIRVTRYGRALKRDKTTRKRDRSVFRGCGSCRRTVRRDVVGHTTSTSAGRAAHRDNAGPVEREIGTALTRRRLGGSEASCCARCRLQPTRSP